MTARPDGRSLATPVVLVAFNRPDLTARGLEVLRRVRPRTLLVVCDGPRADRPSDPARVAAVRRLLQDVDWPADVRRRYAEENVGCEANIEGGMDWAFGSVDRAIVLEDDCIADPTFFRYCEELLGRYADDGRVWQIAGNSHDVPPRLFHGDSYRFSTWASVWGWATWADRWQRHRAVFPRDHHAPDGDRPVRVAPARPRPGALVTAAARRHFADAAASSDTVTHGWDKHWWLTIMSEGGLSVTPAVNLVENAGFGAAATHLVVPHRATAAGAMAFPLRHPARVALDREVERDLELLLDRVGGRAARTARRLVRSPRLRAAVRGAVYSRPAVAAARRWSRLTEGADARE
ncbi:MAG: glycosyltransferase family 2 protein [Jatrophihabitans sp.]|nr:MAG: glycosyltransferase family 2 protein [Jatrophihabitans sp.]